MLKLLSILFLTWVSNVYATDKQFFETKCGREVLYNEEIDWGVPPPPNLNRGKMDWLPTPLELKEAKRINACELEQLLKNGSVQPVFVAPVFKQGNTKFPKVKLVPNSIWVPIGALADTDPNILYFIGQKIAYKIGGVDKLPIVVYSRSQLNWESINFIKQLSLMGFKKIYWFRGGQDSWLNSRPERPFELFDPINAYEEFIEEFIETGKK